MLSIIALIVFVVGLLVWASTEKSEPSRPVQREIGRMLMWCGFLVMLAMLAGWHAVPLR